MVLAAIAAALAASEPEVHLMMLLVGERPEEVTDLKESVPGEVVYSTFDQSAADHIMVAELAIERAKRLVEASRDVVVLLDSITRLGRGYNLAASASSRILAGKRIFPAVDLAPSGTRRDELLIPDGERAAIDALRRVLARFDPPAGPRATPRPDRLHRIQPRIPATDSQQRPPGAAAGVAITGTKARRPQNSLTQSADTA